MTKTFELGTVLSVTTGRLLAPIESLYDILNHMTGDNLFTHQLPRANRECSPWLLRWFPELGAVDIGTLDQYLASIPDSDEACRLWLADQSNLPQSFEVDRIPMDDHDRINPIDELESMVGKDRVIAFELPEEE